MVEFFTFKLMIVVLEIIFDYEATFHGENIFSVFIMMELKCYCL